MPPLKICRPGPGPRGPVRKYGPGHTGYADCLLAGSGLKWFHPDPTSKQSATPVRHIPIAVLLDS